MTLQQIIVFTIAAVVVVLWVTTLILNFKEIQTKSIDALQTGTHAVVGWGNMVMAFILMGLAIFLFFGAAWFTLAPFFGMTNIKAGSIPHITGSIVDWAAFFLVDALIRNLALLTEAIQYLIKPPDEDGEKDELALQGDGVVDPNDDRLVEGPIAAATSFPAAGGAPSGGPPQVMKKDVPDTWF